MRDPFADPPPPLSQERIAGLQGAQQMQAQSVAPAAAMATALKRPSRTTTIPPVGSRPVLTPDAERRVDTALGALPTVRPEENVPGKYYTPLEKEMADAEEETLRQKAILQGGDLGDIRQLQGKLLANRGGYRSDVGGGVSPDVEQRIAAGKMTPLQREQALSGRMLGGQTGVEARAARQAKEAAYGAQMGKAWESFRPTNPDIRQLARETLAGNDMGPFNPTNERATAKHLAGVFESRAAGRRAGKDWQGEPLAEGQLANIASRQQDLDRRQLRATLRGMGTEHRLSDTQADTELRKQAIMAVLKGEKRAPTEEENQLLGNPPGATADMQRGMLISQATEGGGAILERREREQQRETLTGKGGTQVMVGEPGEPGANIPVQTINDVAMATGVSPEQWFADTYKKYGSVNEFIRGLQRKSDDKGEGLGDKFIIANRDRLIRELANVGADWEAWNAGEWEAVSAGRTGSPSADNVFSDYNRARKVLGMKPFPYKEFHARLPWYKKQTGTLFGAVPLPPK